MEAKHNLGSPLEWAIAYNRDAVIKILLDNGANANGVTFDKKCVPPPVIMAASTNNLKIIKMLV